jgi:hypothetical protein
MTVSEDLTGAADSTAPAGTLASIGTALTKCDPTLNALAEAQRVEEVKDIRDKAAAMEEYARQAKNTELIERAVDTRFRAERRAGEILAGMKARGERDDGKGNRNPTLKSQAATPKLADLGITKSESSKWQQLAALELEEFEIQVEQGKKRALAAIDRTAKLARAKACAAGHSNPNAAVHAYPNKVLTAIKILCAEPSVENVAAALARGQQDIASADLARAVAFLQSVQNALCTAKRVSS